jgi:hypothetical protein
MVLHPFEARPPFCRTALNCAPECARYQQIAKKEHLPLTSKEVNLYPCLICSARFFDRGNNMEAFSRPGKAEIQPVEAVLI